MWPEQRADALVTALDRAHSEAARAGRGLAEAALDLDAVARRMGSGDTGWRGRAGTEARVRTEDVHATTVTLSGHCLFVADVLRVEGSRLARALVAGGDRTEVEDADRALAGRLAEAADALAGRVDAGTRPCLDLSATTGGDPRATAALWHSLPPADRERLARDHPELGSAAGLPAAQRDALNRARLARLVDAGTAPAALEALAAHLDVDPRRHLLALHWTGGDGPVRAVVADGDPDGAGRVVTLVPGTGSSVGSLDRTAGRAAAVCDAAEAADAAEADRGVDAATGSCVAVSWQGYDAPPDLAAAGTSTDRATAHAGDLRDFAAGLDAVDVQDGHDAPHAAVGYSYGSAVLGAAAADPRGLAADRMVHVGSPGAAVGSLGAQWVDEGGTPRQAADGDVAAVVSRWDPVPWWSLTGVLGAPPGSEGFGGVAVDVTEPGADARDLRGAHSRYFDPGTVSLAEIGRLVAGRD